MKGWEGLRVCHAAYLSAHSLTPEDVYSPDPDGLGQPAEAIEKPGCLGGGRFRKRPA